MSIARNDPPAPFIGPALAIGTVEGTLQLDYHVEVGARVSGRLRVREGGPEPQGFVEMEVTESRNGDLMASHAFGLMDGDGYELYVLPGSLVDIRTTATGDYAPYWSRATVDGDLVRDIELSTLPSLVVWGADGISEGARDTHGVATFGFQLSAPAGAEGASLSYRTIAETATPGDDFTAAEGTLAFDPGADFQSAGVDFAGDDRFEGNECFEMVAEGVHGASPTSAVQRFCLYDDDARTGGPGQKQEGP